MAQEEELIRQESYFWNQCVALRKPPKYTEKADLMLKSIQGRYGVQENKQIVLPPSYAANMTSYLKLKKRKSELKRQMDQIDEQMKLAYAPIKEAMEGAEEAVLETGNIRYLAGYNRKVTTSINKDSLEVLQLMHPDIYREYAQTNTSQSFYIKEDKAS